MSTFKTRRRRCRQWTKANRPEAIARRNASNDARRMAQDPPIYPAERKPGTPTGDFIHARIHGRLVQIELHAPKPTQYGIRPRNDQWCAVIDGEQWAPAAGLVLVLEELRKRVPRAMSRRAIATMER